jgi:proteasome beta subunit
MEDRYTEKILTEEGVDLAIRALSSAMKRDSASGNDMRIVKITETGYVEVGSDEIDKRKAALAI